MKTTHLLIFILFSCIQIFGQATDRNLGYLIANAEYLSYDKKDITKQEKKILKDYFGMRFKIWNPNHKLSTKKSKRLLIVLKNESNTIIAYQLFEGVISCNELVYINLERKKVEKRIQFLNNIFTQEELSILVTNQKYWEQP